MSDALSGEAIVVSKTPTNEGEVWTVEGLVHPGLYRTRFVFKHDSLVAVELRYRNDLWWEDPYLNWTEKMLKPYFEHKYGVPRRIDAIRDFDNCRESKKGYAWNVGATSLNFYLRSITPLPFQKLFYREALVQYFAQGANANSLGVSESNPWIVTPKSRLDAEGLADRSDFDLSVPTIVPRDSRTPASLDFSVSVGGSNKVVDQPVYPLVQFFELRNDTDIVQSENHPSTQWNKPFENWRNRIEGFETFYAENPNERERAQRKYFGYIVSIYHDNRLRAVRADPELLLSLFPPKTFISTLQEAIWANARRDYATALRCYNKLAAKKPSYYATIASYYADGVAVEKDYARAVEYYKKSFVGDNGYSHNELAWLLATCPDDTIRDGFAAVSYAKEACEASKWLDWEYVDTLAAALAESGDWEGAEKTQLRALSLAGVDEASRKDMEARLSLYRDRKPYRQKSSAEPAENPSEMRAKDRALNALKSEELADGTRITSKQPDKSPIVGISDIKTENTSGRDTTNLLLKIGIRKGEGEPIDPSKLRIIVLFYDLLDKKIVLTDAEVNSEWTDPRHDWIEVNPEILNVTYFRAKKSTSRRTYLGYVVRIIYSDKLQEERAEPPRLLFHATPLKSDPDTPRKR